MSNALELLETRRKSATSGLSRQYRSTYGQFFTPSPVAGYYWMLDHAAITHIHVFESRDKAFSDDDVLQENVILRLVVGTPQGNVEVTASHDHTFSDTRHRLCPFEEIVTPDDEERFIHVPTIDSQTSNGLPGLTLHELGLDVCTGPVVDFRMRKHLRMQPEAGTVPLLYASHFVNHHLEWPRQTRKPNAIVRNKDTERWLMPNGCYVVMRRFTSKEEKRRVIAYVLDEGVLPGEMIGFENHLNVIHKNKHGLLRPVARGLAAYLNSQEVDDYFRTFSGHTQVNATDLRRLRYPSLQELEKRGRAWGIEVWCADNPTHLIHFNGERFLGPYQTT